MSGSIPDWILIIHGGAKEISPEEEKDNRDGLEQALAAGRAILEGGGSAVEACEASVRVLERLPVFNAGVGSVLNEAGEVEMKVECDPVGKVRDRRDHEAARVERWPIDVRQGSA